MHVVEFGSEEARVSAAVAVFAAALVLFGCGGRSSRSEQSSNGGTAAGGSAAKAGASATGGSTEMASGGSPGDAQSCTEDADCTQCLYTATPTSTAECASSLGCCGGQVMNESTCALNQAAFQAVCAGQNVRPPICPCVSPGVNPVLGCKNGECGFYASSP
jgi:hypothetical protein